MRRTHLYLHQRIEMRETWYFPALSFFFFLPLTVTDWQRHSGGPVVISLRLRHGRPQRSGGQRGVGPESVDCAVVRPSHYAEPLCILGVGRVIGKGPGGPPRRETDEGVGGRTGGKGGGGRGKATLNTLRVCEDVDLASWAKYLVRKRVGWE